MCTVFSDVFTFDHSMLNCWIVVFENCSRYWIQHIALRQDLCSSYSHFTDAAVKYGSSTHTQTTETGCKNVSILVFILHLVSLLYRPTFPIFHLPFSIWHFPFFTSHTFSHMKWSNECVGYTSGELCRLIW